jgi:hypothetical protein
MPIDTNAKDCATVAEACIDRRQGYAAALLLLCAADAIARGMLKADKRNTRLAVLQDPTWFNLNPILTTRQIKDLTDLYRHMLAHTATIAPGTF